MHLKKSRHNRQLQSDDDRVGHISSIYRPITNPDKILCVGLNYRDHQAETGRGGEDNPTIFVRFAAAQVGHMANMVRPFESNALDYEGEIAMIIGRHARRVEAADWLDYIAGFSCYNDGSVRDYQRHTSQFTPGKNFTGTGGFGPWMMTPDEVGDLEEMEITTRLNGNVMQNAKSKQLVFGFAGSVDVLFYVYGPSTRRRHRDWNSGWRWFRAESTRLYGRRRRDRDHCRSSRHIA